MLERVKQFILTEHLFPAKLDTVLVAVSGGIDSSVLLDILYSLKSELKIKMVVIHYNHQVRGKASKADENFVKKLARRYRVRIITGRRSQSPIPKNETELRAYRLKFFQKVLSRYPHAVLATGHTATDQIETFLMRLAKGSRLRGLLGIKPRSGRLIHPLLGESRQNIEEYARHKRLKFREDLTNYNTQILRNKIRHKIIPYLKRNMAGSIEQSLIKTMTDLTRHYQIFEQTLNEVIQRCTKKVKVAVLLHRQEYENCDLPLRRALLEYCISEVYPLNYIVSDPGFRQWDTFILKAQCGRRKSFHDQEIASAERKYIHFGNFPQRRERHYTLNLGKKVIIGSKTSLYFQQVARNEVKFTADRKIEFIDGTKSGKTLQVRFWKRGDIFQPLGMQKNKKLSDFFIDLKVGRREKQQIPLVCHRDVIVWVAGYRLNDRFKISSGTRKYYKLELRIN